MATRSGRGKPIESKIGAPFTASVRPGMNGLTRQQIPGGTIRLGVAKEIYSVLNDLGADPDEIIARAGLDPHLFSDGDNTISFATLGHLVSHCVVATQCQHFGLLVGQKAPLSALGLVGGLMQHSETVDKALRGLVSHLHLYDRGAAPMLTVNGGIVILSYAVYVSGAQSVDQISDGAIATATNVMRALCGPDWVPSEVLLPRRLPHDPGPHQRFFRAPVRFEQEAAALVFPAAWLDHRIVGADPVFRRMFEQRIVEIEAYPGMSLKDDLRRVLRTRLMFGKCSAATVADIFAVHRRTLNRRLSQEGTGFKAVADEIRFEIARQLLVDTDMSLGQVAAALDFSEAGAFTRAFRRWSGQTPTKWRAEHRPNPKPIGRSAAPLR
jgi:AraC-like DNA-binding protein